MGPFSTKSIQIEYNAVRSTREYTRANIFILSGTEALEGFGREVGEQ